MPTGYTAGIIDGKITTFQQFAKLCMRAFGATIHMRDEDLGIEYTPDKPSDYYPKEIAKTKKKISALEVATDKKLVADYKKELATSKAYHLNSIEKAKANKKTLEKMLAEVNAWQPPTAEHIGLKDFMIQQLTSTINYDGSTKYHEAALVEISDKLSSIKPDSIRAEKLSEAHKHMAYCQTENKNEVERVTERNKWVDDLLNSI